MIWDNCVSLKVKVTLLGCLPNRIFLYSDGISVNIRPLLYGIGFWVGLRNAGPEKLLKLITFLHIGECNYTDKVLFVHFISMQLNFPVLSMFSCVALQNASFMDGRMQV